MKRQKVDNCESVMNYNNNEEKERPAVSSENAFTLLTQAMFADDAVLAANCWFTIDNMPLTVFQSTAFHDIHHDLLCYTLKRNTLRIREVDLFKAVVSWSITECRRLGMSDTPVSKRQVIGRALNYIRFPLMSLKEFKTNVFKTGILTEQEVTSLFNYFFAYYQKPPVAFPTALRLPTELVMERFSGISRRESKPENQIAFSVDQSIILIGFGLYGRNNRSQNYGIRIQIKKRGSSSDEILASNTLRDTRCGCTNKPFRVLFKTPLVIHAGCRYIAYAKLVTLGQPTYLYENIGVGGREKVEVSDRTSGVKVEFSFFDAIIDDYKYSDDTDVLSGQIPQFIFYPSVVDVKTLN